METILCKKCGTEYHTTSENLNRGKYLKCKVCSRTVFLRRSKALAATSNLIRLRPTRLPSWFLSLLRLLGPRNKELSYPSRRRR